MVKPHVLKPKGYQLRNPQGGIEQGKKELGVGFSQQETKSDNFEMTMTTINLMFCYYVTPEILVAGNLFIIGTEADGSESTTTVLEMQGKYHFIIEQPEIVPYLGLQVGTYSMDADGMDGSGSSYGYMGGVKYFMAEDTSINLEYNWKTVSMEIGGYNADSDITTLSIGASLYF